LQAAVTDLQRDKEEMIYHWGKTTTTTSVTKFARLQQRRILSTATWNIPLGEDNYDHFSHQVRQTPAKADPQYSHLDRADVKSFTINNTSGSLTVNERDNVIFTCSARGRPAPSVTLHSRTGAELERVVGNALSDEFDKKLLYTKLGVTAEDMGTYFCTADNNFTNPKRGRVQMNVRIAPRWTSASKRENPTELNDTSLNFTVLAYPVPNNFTFTFYGNKLTSTLSSVPSGTFNVTSIVEDPSLPVVICSIKPLAVPHDRLGVYRVEVSNGLEGTYKYFFRVKTA
ncbi:hypothetical protein BaRGS_00030417, partial [Batillaria attramentaria]